MILDTHFLQTVFLHDESYALWQKPGPGDMTTDLRGSSGQRHRDMLEQLGLTRRSVEQHVAKRRSVQPSICRDGCEGSDVVVQATRQYDVAEIAPHCLGRLLTSSGCGF